MHNLSKFVSQLLQNVSSLLKLFPLPPPSLTIRQARGAAQTFPAALQRHFGSVLLALWSPQPSRPLLETRSKKAAKPSVWFTSCRLASIQKWRERERKKEGKEVGHGSHCICKAYAWLPRSERIVSKPETVHQISNGYCKP